MTNTNQRRARGLMAWMMAVALLAMPLASLQAQTRIEVPRNKYDIREDIQAGQQAAQQVEQQMPILRDGYTEQYVEDVGRRLVAAIPAEFQHPEFQYRFRVVDARDINAFALPGGPMYVNRGMIEAARSEGEMAGVMAHEISHVALRHATAQATETQKYQIGSVLGQIAGAVIGGGIGQVIGAGSQIGFGAGALKYSRKYETQADILGAQIMARAGYDPRDLANMFRTIEQQGGGSGGPEWLSSHPNPGNRYQRISQEAAMLRVNPNSATQDTRAFQQVQARLRGMPRARTMEEIARSGQRNPQQDSRYPQDNRYPNTGYPSGERVAYPSGRYRTAGNDLFRANIPDNWRELANSQNSSTYAPEGAYSQQGEISHGVMFGIDREQSNNLQQASQQYIQDLLRVNTYLRQQSGFQRTSVGGRNGLATTLAGRSPLTGQTEIVTVVTTMLRSGDIFYMIAVAPQSDYRNYQRTFQSILSSVQINNNY
ncbi:MAG TPA: M48 family metallopeptidase [Pyrinomonadaceae bacterium]